MTPAQSRCRAYSYNNIDGLGELSIGFMMASVVAFLWSQFHLPEHSLWTSDAAVWIWLIATFSILQFGPKAIKKRITYPRTGFVEYRKRDLRWISLLGAVVGAMIPIGFLLAYRRHWSLDSFGTFAGLLLAAAYAYGFARTVRWKWIVAALLALGSLALLALPADLAMSFSNGQSIPGFSSRAMGSLIICFVLCGALMLISGGITFWRYVRDTPPAPQEGV